MVYFAGRLLRRDYRSHFRERLGFLPQTFTRTGPRSVWLHAVSAGEVAAAVPLIRELRRDRPNIPFFVSVGTVAGRAAAGRQLAGLVDGVFYAPLDYVCCVRRVVRAIRPASLLVLETEIWPNLLHEVNRTGAAVVIASARISDRAWPRYRTCKLLFRPILQIPNLVMVQGETDRARFAELGVPVERLRVSGNLKYDFALSGRPGFQLPDWGADPVWIAASTVGPNERGSFQRHDVDEDAIVIDTFRKLSAEFPRQLLILAPRQPARFQAVADQLRRMGISFVRRAELRNDSGTLELPGVLLLDSIGELPGLYPRASAAFVGGSIAPRGGHNILEPAAAGVPIIIGPHTRNFQSIVDDFLAASALLQIHKPEELAEAVGRLLRDKQLQTELGRRGQRLVDQERGVARRIATAFWPLHDRTFRKPVYAWPIALLLKGLSALWTSGGNRRRHHGEALAASRPRLGIPVVSIGGITMGGSGKTPLCDYIARYLRLRGFSPAILTRGYGRRSPAAAVVAPAGSHMPAALTGDEAQIFLRAGNAALGVGADRYDAAESLLKQIPETDVFLLDDGFQHAALHRDFNIAVIDGLDPFGGDCVFPVGRLREPLNALRRADAFVITRAEEDGRFAAISERLRQWKPAAPCYRARLLPRQWRDHQGEVLSVERGHTVAAFCGLGNPQNFWNTLASLGLDVAFRWSFDDHHEYQPIEIARLAHQAVNNGADILVTTEKDTINLPANTDCLLRGLKLAWLQIEMVVEEEERFFSDLCSRLAHRAMSVGR